MQTKDTYDYITSDFIHLWDSLSSHFEKRPAGGNYAFSLLALVFLEWICHIIKPHPDIFRRFSEELFKCNPKYFKAVTDKKIIIDKKLKLPFLLPKNHGCQLIDLIFCHLRNGIAHTYEPQEASFKHGTKFLVTCMMFTDSFDDLLQNQEASQMHLRIDYVASRTLLRIIVVPGLLFNDFKVAFDNARVLDEIPEYSPAVHNHLKHLSIDHFIKTLESQT